MWLRNFICQNADCLNNVKLSDKDSIMIEVLGGRKEADEKLIEDWLREYNTLRYLDDPKRVKVAEQVCCFINRNRKPNNKQAETEFIELLKDLKEASGTNMLSATSKLMWCRYPEHIAMFDSFALASARILQSLDPCLCSEELGPRPGPKDDQQKFWDYFSSYNSLILTLTEQYSDVIEEQKRYNGLNYPYNLRLMDKILLRLAGKD